METPKSGRNLRPTRKPTPRLSERKKKLFDGQNLDDQDDAAESELLHGITPLRHQKRNRENQELEKTTPKRRRNIEMLLKSSDSNSSTGNKVIRFIEEGDTDESSEQEMVPLKTITSRRSPRLRALSVSSSSPESNKENSISRLSTAAEEQLPNLFNSSLRIRGQSGISAGTPQLEQMDIIEDECGIGQSQTMTTEAEIRKRPYTSTVEDICADIPQHKVRRLEEMAISTKSFYSKQPSTPSSTKSSTKNSNYGNNYLLHSHPETPSSSSKGSPRTQRLRAMRHINKGVTHKIRKPLSTSQQQQQRYYHMAPLKVDHILSQLRNEKLRNLITVKRQERAQIEKVHNIFREAKDPIKMARPLSVIESSSNDSNNNNNNGSKLVATSHVFDVDFSDIEQSDDESEQEDIIDDLEPIIPLIRHSPSDHSLEFVPISPQSSGTRKFFKSGRRNSAPMEVKITDNISARVCNGRISLMQQQPLKTRRLRVKSTATVEFSAEQATVDAILRNLDDTTFGDLIESEEPANLNALKNTRSPSSKNTATMEDTPMSTTNDSENSSIEFDPFEQFRNRLPYNTNDDEIIEQQKLLLDFLISNNICNEANFNIFIADPENPVNKAAASQIVDDIILVVNAQEEEFKQRLPYNTSDPALIEQQEYLLDFLIKNNICTEENFDIFIANYDKRRDEAESIIKANLAVEEDPSERNSISPYTAMEVNSVVTKEGILISETPDTFRTNEINQPTDSTTLISELVDTTEKPILSVAENVASSAESTSAIPETTALPSEPITAIVPLTTQTSQPEQATTSKLYPIFTDRLQTLQPIQSKRRNKTWCGGSGANQYQLDLGQKQFGAQQCKHCGLIYTVHEPEEEKLHREYHVASNILRFQGWIDEDIVAVDEGWSNDGRIIRLSDASPPRRLERLCALLDLVDRELGCTEYILPTTFVAYLAVRKYRIVGLCIVEPLSKAHKYVHADGIDYCSQEEYDVKCGISRIWVSPLQRRRRIASKLIKSVQLNSIRFEDLPIEAIAFSSPTDVGRLFAQKISKTESFLVYQ